MDEVTKKVDKGRPSAGRGGVRVGRPPHQLAGEVEQRVLEAAIDVFLERGFDGASIDLIAETARAGKPTIYSRFPNKPALFAAALANKIAATTARIGNVRPSGANIEERLASIGYAMLRETLADEFIALLRLAISEASRSPELVSGLFKAALQRGSGTVAALLEEVRVSGGPGASPAGHEDGASAATQCFNDLIMQPLVLRALAGESLETLRAEIGPHVRMRVTFYLAACRNGMAS